MCNYQKLLTLMHLLWIFTITAGGTAPLSGKSISTNNGLPSNTVYDMLQDPYGYVWIGTPNGLCRYDGYTFTNFKSIGCGNGKTNGDAGTLHLDKKHRLLWIRTITFNYACYDLKRGHFVDFTGECDPQKTYQRYIAEEDGIWMYEEKSGIRHVRYPGGRFYCQDYSQENGRLPKNRIKRLVIDKRHNAWVVTDKGLYRIDGKGKVHTVSANGDYLMGNQWGDYCFFLRNDGRIFIYDVKGRLIRQQAFPNTLRRISEVNGNIVWNDKWIIMSRKALTTMDCHTFDMTQPKELQMEYGIHLDQTGDSHWISDRNSVLWHFSTDYGIKSFRLLNDTGFNITRKRKFSTIQGADGKFYIATYGNGLYIYDPRSGQTEHLSANDASPVLTSNYLTDILMTRDGSIWVSQEEAGIVCLQHKEMPHAKQLYPTPSRQGELSNYIKNIRRQENGNIVFSTRSQHVYTYHPDRNTIEVEGTVTAPSEYIDSIIDRMGRTWIATWELGLLVSGKDSGGKPFKKQLLTRSTTESRINAMAIDTQNRLWVATYNGLYMTDLRQNELSDDMFKHFTTQDGLPSNNMATLLATRDGSIWAGGQGTGIVKCTLTADSTLTLSRLTIQQGLLGNNIHSLAEDQWGNIWAGAEGCITRITPHAMSVANYRIMPSPLSNLYSDNCALRLDDGRIVLGTHNGLTLISPPEHTDSTVGAQRAYVTNMSINGTSIYEDEDSLHSRPPYLSGRISLSHTENSFTLYFSSFDYEDQQHTRYQFYLEGADKDWRTPTTLHAIDYNNLAPGTYTFHLRIAGTGLETTLTITIRQPWYNTWWAWLIYLIAITAITVIGHKIWKERFTLHQQMKLEKEVADFRINFFTQVAHEFRTPLAIIQGAVDKMAEEASVSKKTSQTAIRGVKRLTQLINQLMEFRKVNTDNLHLSIESGDIVSFVRNIYQDFWGTAQQKDLSLTFTPFDKRFDTMFDRHIVDTICYNLMSNAVKYTPQGGNISVKLKQDGDWLLLSVEDSGKGIQKESQELLFQPFMHGYASQGGMGIGLYTANKMAQAHKGQLTYSASEELGGAKFTFRFPCQTDYYDTSDIKSLTAISNKVTEKVATEEFIKEPLPLSLNEQRIIVIEDDPDMLDQIKSEIGIYFKVEGYTSGIIGLEAVETSKPALLICDVMLPDINGYEIVRQIKSKGRGNNMPIIMLTALDDEQQQIKGYKAGADDYMVKPCNYHVLMARIIQLIRWQQSQAQPTPTNDDPTQEVEGLAAPILTSHTDKRLLDNINIIIAQHINDPDFTVEVMAEQLKIGRTKLYGKCKELTGLTPNKLLVKERMEAAARLLCEYDLNISEISFRVGIPDTSYFNRCFKQQFGITPSQYKKEH